MNLRSTITYSKIFNLNKYYTNQIPTLLSLPGLVKKGKNQIFLDYNAAIMHTCKGRSFKEKKTHVQHIVLINHSLIPLEQNTNSFKNCSPTLTNNTQQHNQRQRKNNIVKNVLVGCAIFLDIANKQQAIHPMGANGGFWKKSKLMIQRKKQRIFFRDFQFGFNFVFGFYAARKPFRRCVHYMCTIGN